MGGKVKINKIFILPIIFCWIFYSLSVTAADEISENYYDIVKIGAEDEEVQYFIEDFTYVKNMDKPVVALALSGGGARGLVNVGVIKALEDNNIKFDMIIGSSMGSVIAVMYGSGMSTEDITNVVDRHLISSLIELNYPFSHSILNADKLNIFMEELLPEDKLEDFPIPTAVLSYDLAHGVEYIHTTGKVSNVVQSSYAIPLAFPVQQKDGLYLIDPGMIELVPSRAAAAMGADIIIATSAFDELPYQEYDTPVRAWMRQTDLIKRNNSMDILKEYSDLSINCDVGDYSFMDFNLAEKLINIGYQAALEKMPEIKKIVAARKEYQKASTIDYDLIEDLKYERAVLSYTFIRPVVYFGKDHTYLKKSLFQEDLNQVQPGLIYENRNLHVDLLGNDVVNNKWEAKIDYLKLTDNVDLSFFVQKEQEQLSYEVLAKYYSYPFTAGIGWFDYRGEKLVHLTGSYRNHNKNNELDGELEIFQPMAEEKSNQYILSGKYKTELDKDKLQAKILYADSYQEFVPVIYRGYTDEDSVKSKNIQVGLEYLQTNNFEYSQELLHFFRLTGIDTCYFLDYRNLNQNSSYAVGIDATANLSFLGMKPSLVGGYLSYDFNNQSAQYGINFNIEF
ncbi:MAG: patatin-like phospholipase family protein [Halothermotrichaceae bacterium]